MLPSKTRQGAATHVPTTVLLTCQTPMMLASIATVYPVPDASVVLLGTGVNTKAPRLKLLTTGGGTGHIVAAGSRFGITSSAELAKVVPGAGGTPTPGYTLAPTSR